MMMIVLLFLLLAAVLAIAIGESASRARPAAPPAEPLPDEPSPTEFAAEDPLAALVRYGTPDDAARLGEQGVDLGGLGYRPGGE